MLTEFYLRNAKRGAHLLDLDGAGWIILKRFLDKLHVRIRLVSTGSRYVPVAGSCEHGNDSSNSEN
jgi:hypothetical protein